MVMMYNTQGGPGGGGYTPVKRKPLSAPVTTNPVRPPTRVAPTPVPVVAPRQTAPLRAPTPLAPNPTQRMTTTAQPRTTAMPNLPAFTLPSLDGSQFVARPTGGTQNPQSPADMMAALSAQFQANPGQDPIAAIQAIQAAFAGQQLPSAADTVMGNLDQLLGEEGSYITNARRRGMEQANARGLMNSSIASGTSQRAATEAAQPILSEMMDLNNQREAQTFQERMNAINATVGLTQQERDAAIQRARDQFNSAVGLTENRENRAFTGQQNQLDRVQGVNNALLAGQLDQRRALLGSQLGREEAVLDTKLRQTLQNDAVAQQDWLASRDFTREFNGALSMMPITSAFQLNDTIQRYAMEHPEVYTPEVISGMSNFFNRNMLSMLQQYFPNLTGGA